MFVNNLFTNTRLFPLQLFVQLSFSLTKEIYYCSRTVITHLVTPTAVSLNGAINFFYFLEYFQYVPLPGSELRKSNK